MLKLLEMYKGRKTIEIEEKYDKQIHEIESNDAVQIFIEQAEQTLKGILNTENLKLNLNSDVLEYTQETINRNLPIWATYEPGSTFKIITLAASLEEQTINLFEDQFYPVLLGISV